MTKNSQIAAAGIFMIQNPHGLHTRPATELVKCASAFKSEIVLIHRKMRVNAKSLLGILMLAVPKGKKIKIEAKGKDAEQAVEAICVLASSCFYIGY